MLIVDEPTEIYKLCNVFKDFNQQFCKQPTSRFWLDLYRHKFNEIPKPYSIGADSYMKQYVDRYHEYYIKELTNIIRFEYMLHEDTPKEFIKYLVETKDRFSDYDKLNSYYIVISQSDQYGTYICIYNSNGKIKLELYVQYVGYKYGYSTEDTISKLILDGKYGKNIFPKIIDYYYCSKYISKSKRIKQKDLREVQLEITNMILIKNKYSMLAKLIQTRPDCECQSIVFIHKKQLEINDKEIIEILDREYDKIVAKRT